MIETNIWAQLRQKKSARWSMYGLMFFAMITVLTPFLANDKPWVLSYEGALYSPIFKKLYPETQFGGTSDRLVNFRDPYMQAKINEKGWMFWPPLTMRFDTLDYWTDASFPSPPSWTHPFGTDAEGHDLLAAIMYGLTITGYCGFFVALLSMAIGMVAGALQGYYGARVDFFGQRVMEVFGGIPLLYVVMTLTHFYTMTFFPLVVILSLFQWLLTARIARSLYYHERQQPYVLNAQLMGLSNTVIIRREIFPNVLHVFLSQFPFSMMGAITTLTTLDFLGFGLPLYYPSLGRLLQQGRANLHAPWIVGEVAGILITFLLFLLFVGLGLKDLSKKPRATEIVDEGV